MPKQQQVSVLPKGLKAWRRERNFSQADLAAATGHKVSEGLIAQIETGRRQPGLSNALAIAKALGIDLEAVAVIHVDLSSFVLEEGSAA